VAEEFVGIGFGGERAAYASNPWNSRGRMIDEVESPTRTPFQRDRDRVVHSTAFRRLNHKTQVFFSHESDHYRTRLTHTIEVAQIARAFARALKLDEDLSEAVALVHDFGHTPFGHTGEDVLDELMKPHGGFDHNVQALRVVTKLEHRYAEFDGLNLTFETLEGLVKHNGPLIDKHEVGHDLPETVRHYCALHDLQLASHASLEAQAAAIADDVAYNTHDIDDGLRSGLLTLDGLRAVPLVDAVISSVDEQYPHLDEHRRAHEVTRRVMTTMVEDVIRTARARITESNVDSVDGVREAGKTLVCFSDTMARHEKELKSYLFANLYRHKNVMRVRRQAEDVIRDLFGHYMENPIDMGVRWVQKISQLDEKGRALRVADYIAGMTDSYALAQHRRLFDDTPDLR